MKITNGQIVAALNMIDGLKKDNRHLPIRLSYALNKNQNILYELYKPYEATLKTIDQEKDKDAVLALLSEENEVELHKVTLETLESAYLSINEMEIIQTFMMEEPDDSNHPN